MNGQSEKDELYQASVAMWKAREAEESEQRRREGKIAIWLARSPSDAETFTKEHQVELHGVVAALREHGVELEAPFLAVDAVDAVSGHTGQLIVSLAQIASPVVTAALVAWLKGRPGRKVRVEFHPSGKLKTIEAQTDEQVLSIAAALDQEARAKIPKSETE
jgi:hypothetical protein